MSEKIDKIKNLAKIRLKPVLLLLIMLIFSCPNITKSQVSSDLITGPESIEAIKSYYNGPTLPEIKLRKARRTMFLTVTAYNSEPAQTDDTPFITAFGTQVREGIVATNFLSKGTVIRFPDMYGDQEFVVEDRMNERYYYHLDIWMPEKQDSVNFGVKFLKVEIL
ncbi:MAG: hypothetical protein COV55_03250 [Candidatus Komeilibacteria bacterium CG11_big_fil_rev_8_21_14_0_20_36_20]|uniref:3D domain-containing protein n=1 Tax=Candidatus Komeilibacteria bacterium CG11_big_fil_rev_8_21_14_0_20_36_20 TaxID=1974477 RepID=A0A2H0NCD4_9BACT|nr:MAG: hypothetical protein COV55_03250 [Candidatus Komeilibacteria bacterium CG11_big_fil_rev_8_21_14_0_20_36_20]PIR81637.1 MAG: hypothetical protein COU21_02660 [Candidatus Komeilibacteria bacterium CG10_big_fil_rev_8_21_14_0_10_36_65]PJC55792.1 MAG: hypothetical protein CO027_00040 [Candidatus Komeilibacteria bacterium CG_4_9_14_0_2_um_filter_36_13]